MKVRIHAHEVTVTAALRKHVELRLGLALGKFSAHVGPVAVHLSQSLEKRDVKESRCQIALGLRRRLKVQETDADLFAAVDRAVLRAARLVARAIAQEQVQSTFVPPPLAVRKRKPRASA